MAVIKLENLEMWQELNEQIKSHLRLASLGSGLLC
jgi:hypothetical protein